MEELMLARSGNKPVARNPGSRVSDLGLVLPSPPTPLGAYVESSDAGSLLFLSGILPVVDRKLMISGRLGENLSVQQGQEAARIASINALAVAKQHLEPVMNFSEEKDVQCKYNRPSPLGWKRNEKDIRVM
jgi:enamine deaminase RidA (YjgF/YER057c/UK114 family)